MITIEELTMGREKLYPQDYTKAIHQNLLVLLRKMNMIRKTYNKPMIVTSGWRPQAINATTKGAAKNSKHVSGLAVDIKDTDSALWNWCMENLEMIQGLGLYLEDKRYTKTWVHFQLGAPSSGLRIFKPHSGTMPNPELWDGQYDSKFNKA